MINRRLIFNLAVLIFGVAFGFKFYFLCNGDVLNHYPLISPDGFDWYTEGTYVFKGFFAENLPSLPVLRPPFFVFITFLDYLAGSKGLILAILYSLSIVMTYFFTLWIIDKGRVDKNKDTWFLFPLAISITVFPINFIKGYLLSDSIAVCLSLFSVFFLIKYFDENKTHLLVISALIALFGGLTQIYALLPYSIFIVMKLINVYKTNKLNSLVLIINLFFIFVLFIFLSYFWRYILKHDSTPQYFEFLKLGFGMLGFYLNTWGYYFMPFVIFFFVIKCHNRKRVKKQFVLLSSAAVTFILGFMCFIYQWPEARFTYYFWPWALIAFFLLFKPVDEGKASLLLVMLMLFMTFLSSDNPWQPSLKKLSFSYHKNWVVSYFESQSVDRGLINCDTPNCEGNEFLSNSDQYIKSVININLRLKEINIKSNY